VFYSLKISAMTARLSSRTSHSLALREKTPFPVAAMKVGDRGEVAKFNSVEELMADLLADD
jgi:hypothetical protein